ncbi:MAG: hypothetical protein RR066_05205 [Mucinivorans sp.]
MEKIKSDVAEFERVGVRATPISLIGNSFLAAIYSAYGNISAVRTSSPI